MRQAIATALYVLRRDTDASDVVVLFGLALLAAGVAIVSAAAALIVLGSVLLYLALFHGIVLALLTRPRAPSGK